MHLEQMVRTVYLVYCVMMVQPSVWNKESFITMVVSYLDSIFM